MFWGMYKFVPIFVLIYLSNYKLVRRNIRMCGKFPNIFLPKSYSDKTLWRKIFDKNPKFVRFSDKIAAKSYAKCVAPELKSANILWKGKSLESAPKELLNQNAILKINNSSNRNIDLSKQELSYDQMRDITKNWMMQTHGKKSGEWSYQESIPTLFIEKNIRYTSEILDIRAIVCSGSVVCIQVSDNIHTDNQRDSYFRPSGERLNAKIVLRYDMPPRATLPEDFCVPVDLAEVSRLAIKLAQDCDHLRVDFMWNGSDLYFAEMTVFPRAGYLLFSDPSLQEEIGSKWDLRGSWFLRTSHRGWRGAYAKALRSYYDRRSN